MNKSITTQIQDTGSNLAKKIILSIDKSLTETYFKIYVCNNGNDSIPTWEDCTQSVKNKEYYVFENKSKTALNGAIIVKMVIEYSDILNINSLTSTNYIYDIKYVASTSDGITILSNSTIKTFTTEVVLKLWDECQLTDTTGYESILTEVTTNG
jgi:hypothetical protein